MFFFLCVNTFMYYALPFWVLFIASIKYWHVSRHVMQLLKSKVGDGHFACASSVVAWRWRSPASPEVIRHNGALVLSRTHPVLMSPASPAGFSITEKRRCGVADFWHTAGSTCFWLPCTFLQVNSNAYLLMLWILRNLLIPVYNVNVIHFYAPHAWQSRTADAAVDTLGTAATVCSVAVLTAACRGDSYLVISTIGSHHVDIVRMW